jgi:hypothetical protein
MEQEGNQKSPQVKKILKFMNKFKKHNLAYVPQIMVNRRYKGAISNWFSVEHDNNYDFMQFCAEKTKKGRCLTESAALFMTIELPDGSYARVRASTQ